jgi:hypothetical protein
MSLEMRELMGSFEAQYQQPRPRDTNASAAGPSARPPRD